MEEKVDLYKIRTLEERFSATSNFVRENWNVLANNLLPIGLPLAVLVGLFMQYYMQDVFAMMADPMAMAAGAVNINWWAYAGLMISSMLFSLFIYATTGAILCKYAEGSLTPDTKWADLEKYFFPIAGKVLIQLCILILIIAVLSVIIGALGAVLAFMNNPVVMASFIMLFTFAFIIVFIPVLSLMQYPIYLEQASAWQGITKGFEWGFKYWGSTFLSCFLGSLILMVCVYILSMPYAIYTVFNMGAGGWLGYVLLSLTFVATLFLQPLLIVFMGFQYTSIASRLSCDN